MNKIILRILLLPWMWLAASAVAHEIRPAVVTVTFAPQQYQIEIVTNVEALLAGVSPKHADTNESPNARRYDELRKLPPPALKTRLQEFAPDFIKGIAVEFRGERVEPPLAAVQIPQGR